MASSLSSLVNNLAEGIYEIKCKYKHNENMKLAALDINITTTLFYTQTLKVI